jgi:hypothetical protein
MHAEGKLLLQQLLGRPGARRHEGLAEFDRRVLGEVNLPFQGTFERQPVVLALLKHPVAGQPSQPQAKRRGRRVQVGIEPAEHLHLDFLHEVRGIDTGPEAGVDPQGDDAAEEGPVPGDQKRPGGLFTRVRLFKQTSRDSGVSRMRAHDDPL